MEDIEGYFVKHDTHETILIENIDKLRESCALVDCTLEVERKYLKAHKVILAAGSLFFDNLFNRYPDKESHFVMKNVTFEELRATVSFIYRGEIVIHKDRLENFLETAKAFQIRGIFKTETWNISMEKNNSVPDQNLDRSRNNCQLENSSSNSQRQDASENKDWIIADELPKVSISYSSSKDISFRESSQSAQLEREMLGNRIYESDTIFESNIDFTQEEKLIPSLKLLPVIDVTSHSTKHMFQQNFQSADIPKGNVDDFSIKNDLTETEDVFSKDYPSREDSRNSVLKKRKEGRISHIDSTVITQQELDSAALQVTQGSAATLHNETRKINQLNSESSGIPYIERKRKRNKSLISDKEAPKKSSSQNRQILKKRNPNLCPLCGKVYKSIYKLNRHLKYICGKEPHLECDLCQKKFKVKRILVRHMETHNQDRRKHFCPQCEKFYKSLSFLNFHIKYICGKEPRLQCDICQKKIKHKSYLIKHMETHNQGRETHSCPQCGKVLKSLYILNRHLKYICGKEPQFQCDICQKKTKLKNALVLHMKLHNKEPKKHSCPQCGKKFKVLPYLNRHLKKVCGKKPHFECDICQKKTKQKGSLLKHMKTHN